MQRKERRQYPRRETALPLKISKAGLDVITETRNISSSGVYCRINKHIPLMSKISVTLLLPFNRSNRVSTEKIICNGVVVRSEPAIVKDADTAYQNIAIFFTDISNKDKDKISQYVMQSLFRKETS